MPNESYWLSRNTPRTFPKLDHALKVDVVVIGAGITGITAAYLLKRAGKSVALLERDRCARADTGHTTAHLTHVTDTRLSQLVKTFGRDHAQAAWDAGNAALQLIHDVVRREKIACELSWVPGYLHLPRSGAAEPNQIEELRAEAQLAQELGFEAEFIDSIPLVSQPGIRFANQGKFDPLKYLSGLLATIPGEGSHVFEESEVEEFSKDPHKVKANGHWVECNFVVIATHVPLQGEKNVLSGVLFQTKISSFSSYVIGAKLPVGLYPQASFWDTGLPYDYLRIDRGDENDYAIFGGEDHKTGQAEDGPARFERLAQRLRAILPAAQVDQQWSGQVVETHDGLPLTGEIADGQFIATGFAGNGMTYGTIAAQMACDAAMKRKNPWADLFDVRRKKLSSAWDYIKENADFPYYLIKDRLASQGKSTADIRRGEARVLRLDGQRVACYRDDHGKLHEVSAVCTHLGCLVHWNAAEITWDCPCHGSRFKPTGEVIAGPAETPLAPVDAKIVAKS